jgi:deoxyhypusine synthase
MAEEVPDAVRALSRWIDEHPGNAARDPEARSWGRLAKVQEEAGEVIAAFIGYTGQNPRKGVTHTVDDVVKELLDVAITALGAVEHLTDHAGPSSLQLLDDAILRVARRAGVVA